MAFRIFLSYARDDDRPPPDTNASGFVTLLNDRLRNRFTELGPPPLDIFFDTAEIKKNERFLDRITKGLKNADALVIVLSPNWLASQNCRLELETFVEQRRWQDEETIAKQIFIAAKRHVDWDARPSILQGTEGYLFYQLEKGQAVEKQQEYYRRGKVEDRFTDRLEELADDLRLLCENPVVAPSLPCANPGGRVVFVARPAADFEFAYARLCRELEGKNYAVVPDPKSEFPFHGGATTFVIDALKRAELAIHVLGQSAGKMTAEGEALVTLQLKLAAAEAARRAAETPPAAPLRRMIWAPRILVDAEEVPLAAAARDPIEVFKEFEKRDAGSPGNDADKINGDELPKFVDEVLDQLRINAPLLSGSRVANAGDKVFLLHLGEDAAYAIRVGKALEHYKVTVVPPETDGPANEVEAANMNLLRECNAVVACWADTFGYRVKAQLRKLIDSDIGRNKEFSFKGLVIGPEPKPDKMTTLAFPPRPEVDVTLDLMNEPVTPETVEPLFRRTT
jgi:hypothetical protein